MIKIIVRQWRLGTHIGYAKETDFYVQLNGVELAIFSTYSTDYKPTEKSASQQAEEFANKLRLALLPIKEAAQVVISYRAWPNSDLYKEAESKLLANLD